MAIEWLQRSAQPRTPMSRISEGDLLRAVGHG